MLIVKVMVGGEYVMTETAAEGILIKDSGEVLTVDFSQYADDKDYIGNYRNVEVQKYKCLTPPRKGE